MVGVTKITLSEESVDEMIEMYITSQLNYNVKCELASWGVVKRTSEMVIVINHPNPEPAEGADG